MNTKRVLSLLLALVLTMTLSLPALAAEEDPEDTGFSDIQPDDWCASYVKVCADHGLMQGIGDGRFAPERALTSVECAVLAARLTDILQGGDGNFPAAPEDWTPEFYTALPMEPGAWYRDAWYYAANQGLEHRLPLRNGTATRYEFAVTIHSVCQQITDLQGLEEINQIKLLPDAADHYALDLYNWGILNGKNQYGSFCGKSTLTRGECAAMLARVLEPSLRLKFDPFPAPETFPTEGYTLTYLMDGTPDCGVNYPICLFGYPTNIMLTLDGKQRPWPVKGSVPSSGLWGSFDYCYIGPYDTSTPDDPWDFLGGLIDRHGKLIVPLKKGRLSTTYPVEGGFVSVVNPLDGVTDETWELLDEQGRFVRELEQISGSPYDAYPPKERNPFRGIEPVSHGYEGPRRFYYVSSAGLPVSQRFDWAGYITDDGQGFVGIDNKVYRIEFAK